MWYFIKSKKNKLWIWKAYNRTDNKLIDWECGKHDKYILLKLIERLKRWNVDIYFSNKWKEYREVIPDDKLKQTKVETYRIESNNTKDIGLQDLEEKLVLYVKVSKWWIKL